MDDVINIASRREGVQNPPKKLRTHFIDRPKMPGNSKTTRRINDYRGKKCAMLSLYVNGFFFNSKKVADIMFRTGKKVSYNKNSV